MLFLAIAVQGRLFEELLALFIANSRWVRQDPKLRESALRALAAANTAITPLGIATLILFAGAVAEIVAITALYQQNAFALAGGYVLAGTIFLTIMAIFPPALALGRTMIQVAREYRLHNRPDARRDTQGTQAQPTLSEQGKTDTEG